MTAEELNKVLMQRGYEEGRRWEITKTLGKIGFPPVVRFTMHEDYVDMKVDESSVSDDFEWVYRMPESMGIADWLLSLHARFYAYSKYETEEDDGVAKKVLDELTGIIGDLMGRNSGLDSDTVLDVLRKRPYNEDGDCLKRRIERGVDVWFYLCDTGRMMLELWPEDSEDDWYFHQREWEGICEWILDAYDILDWHRHDEAPPFNGIAMAAKEIREIIIDIMEAN